VPVRHEARFRAVLGGVGSKAGLPSKESREARLFNTGPYADAAVYIQSLAGDVVTVDDEVAYGSRDLSGC